MNKYLKKALNCVLICLLSAGLVTTPCRAEFSVPSNVDPGAINRDLQMQTEIKFLPDRAEKKGDEAIDTSKINLPQNAAVNSSTKFKLNSITYVGCTVFKLDELNQISAKLIGKKITLQNLNDIANSITDLYGKNGYLTSKAVVPPQTINDGNALIQITEGTVGIIQINGEKWTKSSYIKNNLLKSNNIQEDKLFNVNSLSQSMAEVNSPKYLKGKVTLEKGGKPGQTDIVLDVKDRFPLSVGLGWDNTGRDLVGVQRGSLFTSIDNLTGIGDQVWLNNTFATRTYGLDTGYSIPLGDRGTKLVFGYSMSNTNLGGEYKAYNINGKSNNFSTAIVHPIIKGKGYEVNSRIALDMLNAKTTMYGSESLNDYKLRVLRASLSGNKIDEQGKWLGDLIVSAGIPAMGATPSSSYGEPDSRFVKFNTYLTRVQKLPKNWMGIMRLNTQLSTNSLYPAEQMQLGGAYTVRGYNEASLLGDAGYVLSFEGRTPIPFLPKTIETHYWKNKSIKIPLRDSVKFAVFYDQGWTHLVQQDTAANSQNYFTSVGAGLRVSLGHHMNANFDLGVPIGSQKYDGQAPVRFHFSISTDLL